jgi:hypothetical protein
VKASSGGWRAWSVNRSDVHRDSVESWKCNIWFGYVGDCYAPGEVTSSTGASSAAVGSLTRLDVSIIDGGPARERRDRLSCTLSEAAEDLVVLGCQRRGEENGLGRGRGQYRMVGTDP